MKDRHWFLVYFPKKARSFSQRAFKKSSGVMNKFISVELKLFLLTFVLLSIGFQLLGLHNPVKYAFLVSLVDSIPFLGTGIILIPLSIYFFLNGSTNGRDNRSASIYICSIDKTYRRKRALVLLYANKGCPRILSKRGSHFNLWVYRDII